MYQYVREAFHAAREMRKPVVIGVPYDLQKQPLPDLGEYQPSTATMPNDEPLYPHPHQVEQLAAKLADARCAIIVAGRGAVRAGAAAEIEQLADAAGALLATTLPVRGMFDHNPFSIGISGGYARDIARELGAGADLVVTFGSSLNYYTVDGGHMYPKAEIVQIDTHPQGLAHGMKSGDLHLRADARLAAAETLKALRARGNGRTGIRSAELARRIKEEPADGAVFPAEPGVLDPRRVIEALDAVIPKDYDIASGSGHQAYFHTTMRGRKPENYHVIREFGAIGNGVPFAIGVAAARKDGKTVLFDGDGGFLMHVQELEMVRRQGLKVLFIVLNDGAYGSEIHKLRVDGVDDSGAVFGRTDLASIAKGFGLRGATVTDLGQFAPLFAAYQAQDLAEVWNVHISDRVMNPSTRRQLDRGHGKM
jgi:thiamine pyrophosphate-dependent acetolactate synthase large subunit-like protein